MFEFVENFDLPIIVFNNLSSKWNSFCTPVSQLVYERPVSKKSVFEEQVLEESNSSKLGSKKLLLESLQQNSVNESDLDESVSKELVSEEQVPEVVSEFERKFDEMNNTIRRLNVLDDDGIFRFVEGINQQFMDSIENIKLSVSTVNSDDFLKIRENCMLFQMLKNYIGNNEYSDIRKRLSSASIQRGKAYTNTTISGKMIRFYLNEFKYLVMVNVAKKEGNNTFLENVPFFKYFSGCFVLINNKNSKCNLNVVVSDSTHATKNRGVIESLFSNTEYHRVVFANQDAHRMYSKMSDDIFAEITRIIVSLYSDINNDDGFIVKLCEFFMRKPRDIIDRNKFSSEIVEQKISEEMKNFFVSNPNSIQWFYAALLIVVDLMKIESRLNYLLYQNQDIQSTRVQKSNVGLQVKRAQEETMVSSKAKKAIEHKKKPKVNLDTKCTQKPKSNGKKDSDHI